MNKCSPKGEFYTDSAWDVYEMWKVLANCWESYWRCNDRRYEFVLRWPKTVDVFFNPYLRPLRNSTLVDVFRKSIDGNFWLRKIKINATCRRPRRILPPIPLTPCSSPRKTQKRNSISIVNELAFFPPRFCNRKQPVIFNVKFRRDSSYIPIGVHKFRFQCLKSRLSCWRSKFNEKSWYITFLYGLGEVRWAWYQWRVKAWSTKCDSWLRTAPSLSNSSRYFSEAVMHDGHVFLSWRSR